MAGGTGTLPMFQEQCLAGHGDPTLGLTPPSPRQILKIASNLKYLVDKVIPTVYDVEEVTCPHSRIINQDVIKLVREACGGNPKDKRSLQKYRSVLVFALLKVSSWYRELAAEELYSAPLYELRSIAAQHLCKVIIEHEEKVDLQFLFMQMLLRKYVINENDEDSEPVSVLELAADMHATVVIGSSGFQRCLKWLWRGWIIQSREDATIFVRDESIASPSFKDHFDPERIKTPMYQNILHIIFSFLFLFLYTMVVNDKDSVRVQSLDAKEIIFYLFTLGYVIEEVFKLYYVGSAYFSFWNAFNDTLYTIIGMSMILRFVSLSPIRTEKPAEYWDMISYRILSCAAPFVWSRLLLFLESVQFVGLMLIIIKHMMAESLVFFVLLFLMMFGFLQGFIGLDSSDGNNDITKSILTNLVITVLGDGSFENFQDFAPPYAAILYYGYRFIVTVILLNILIALYANAYQRVVDNGGDEYMALMCQKTLRFIRAPDEEVYVPPLNIIEVFVHPILSLMPAKSGKKWNHIIMSILYSPVLFIVAVKEVRVARRIQYNRMKHLQDDANESDQAWDLTDGFVETTHDLFFQSSYSGVHATRKKNEKSLRKQREAESADPHFSVPKDWYGRVKKSVQPVQEGFQTGIGWETYKLYSEVQSRYEKSEQKIEELSNTLKELVESLKELKLEKQE